MSGQNTLVTCALDAEVKRPSGTLVSRQFYRDKSAQGSGIYKAMDESGNIEIIGGPGAGSNSQLSVDVTYNSATRVLTATPAGGVGALTYAWTIKSFTDITNEDNATYTGATNAATATITAPGANNVFGMAQVKVTDSIGRSANATFAVRLLGVPA